MVNDNVQNTGLNMPEYMYQKQEKPIQLITLLADGSSSQNQPVAGPGSPMRIDLLNDFFQRFISPRTTTLTSRYASTSWCLTTRLRAC